MAQKNICLIHGPNLNMLGSREPEQYGVVTYERLNESLRARAGELGLSLAIEQSNHEGAIVDMIQGAAGNADVIIINPGAYTHTSVAIRDALLAVKLPVIEVHLSNIHKREEFRHHSYVSDIAVGVIAGFGASGYLMALQAAAELDQS